MHACSASSCHAACGACADASPAWLDDPPAHALRRGATPAHVRLRYVIEPDIDGEFEACSRELRERAGPEFAVEFAASSFDEATHAVDGPILDGLRQLPQRITADAPAQPDLHVLPALPLTSFLLETMPGGNMSRHEARMNRLAARLSADKNFLAKRPFLLLYPSNNPVSHLGRRLISVLTRGRIIVASCDPTFPHVIHVLKAPRIVDAVTVPYVAHPFAVRPTGDARRRGRAPLRPVDLMYRGGTHRGMDYGTRAQMAEAFRAANRSGSRVRLHVPGVYHRQMNSHLTNASSVDRVEYAESGAEFARARVCAVPMGDTVTTRRLYDGMQARAVVVLSSSAMSVAAHDAGGQLDSGSLVDLRHASCGILRISWVTRIHALAHYSPFARAFAGGLRAARHAESLHHEKRSHMERRSHEYQLPHSATIPRIYRLGSRRSALPCRKEVRPHGRCAVARPVGQSELRRLARSTARVWRRRLRRVPRRAPESDRRGRGAPARDTRDEESGIVGGRSMS